MLAYPFWPQLYCGDQLYAFPAGVKRRYDPKTYFTMSCQFGLELNASCVHHALVGCGKVSFQNRKGPLGALQTQCFGHGNQS
jgi:hypothetical protein